MIAEAVDTATAIGWAIVAWIVLTSAAATPEPLPGPHGGVQRPRGPATTTTTDAKPPDPQYGPPPPTGAGRNPTAPPTLEETHDAQRLDHRP
ncbi:hypothetical protein [Streptomyces mirabilis]|uniref:hypothetical protein n=1 Tax=Streptomyces mirabilis TaxID=68239 RepID=UPI0033C73E19